MNSAGIKIKLCGLMTPGDCAVANRAHPDYAGFVFAKTRHFVSDETAAVLREALEDTIPAVGVFVDEPIAHVAQLVRDGVIQLVQLHGQEDAAYITALRKQLAEMTRDDRWRGGEKPRIIRAVRVRDGSEILPAQALPCDMLLLDTWDAGVPGGSGKRFDLSLVPALEKPYFLAGGLTPDNVAEALAGAEKQAKEAGGAPPFAVDVSSGVESGAAGGHKDEDKVAQFMRKVRSHE